MMKLHVNLVYWSQQWGFSPLVHLNHRNTDVYSSLNPHVRVAGTGPGARLRLGWNGVVQVLQWHMSACAVQPRPHPHQFALERSSPPHRDLAPRAVLPPHTPRGHGLPRQRPPLAQGREALRLCLLMRRLKKKIKRYEQSYLVERRKKKQKRSGCK